MKYTYDRQFSAHYAGRVIVIPDQVAEAQREYDGKAFPAIDSTRRKMIRVRLYGEAYGLHTSGTGDPVCRAYNSGPNR